MVSPLDQQLPDAEELRFRATLIERVDETGCRGGIEPQRLLHSLDGEHRVVSSSGFFKQQTGLQEQRLGCRGIAENPRDSGTLQRDETLVCRPVGCVRGVADRLESRRCFAELVAFEMRFHPCHSGPDSAGFVHSEMHSIRPTLDVGSELGRPAEVTVERSNQRCESRVTDLVGEAHYLMVRDSVFERGPRPIEVAGLQVGADHDAEDQRNETRVGWTSVEDVETRLRMPKGVL